MPPPHRPASDMVCRSCCRRPPTEWTGGPVSGHVPQSLEEGNALRKYRAEAARWVVPVSISKTYATRGACRPAQAHGVLCARAIRPVHTQSHASKGLNRKGFGDGVADFYRSSAREGYMHLQAGKSACDHPLSEGCKRLAQGRAVVPDIVRHDLLFGDRSSQAATLMKRQTCYLMLVKVAGKDAETVVNARRLPEVSHIVSGRRFARSGSSRSPRGRRRSWSNRRRGRSDSP